MVDQVPSPVTPDVGPTARRIILGAQLRRLREAAGVSRPEAAWEIRASEAKISRLESGRTGFKERDVVDLLTLYGVGDPQERDQVAEMARRSHEQGWWQRYHDAVPKWFEDYLGLEAAASRIQTYETLFVPGLLQTEDYARAVITNGRPDTPSPDAVERLAVRLRRQQVLTRRGGPVLWAILDESVLHRPVGGPGVLAEQTRRLLELSAMPSVVLQILPYSLSGYAAEGSFSVLRFAEPALPDLVYLEHLTGALYLDRPGEIETYARVVDRLAVDALSPEQSRQLLRKLWAER